MMELLKEIRDALLRIERSMDQQRLKAVEVANLIRELSDDREIGARRPRN